MLNKLKELFPILYEEYQHLKRLALIRRIDHLKKLSLPEQAQLLEKLYQQRIGHRLDWNNLQTYTEKMQWEKLYHADPRKTELSDKYRVRDWVASRIGPQYLIPLLGVWRSFDEIGFDKLPDSFVLKTNHGSGTNVIVKDKHLLNLRQTKRKFGDWLRTNYAYHTGFELHYAGIEPLIIAEKYLETNEGELQDYKFLCFGGEPKFCWVDMGRFSKHTRNVYNLDWELQEWNQYTYGIYSKPIPKPENFERMTELARVLCQGFPHVRVDLYNVGGKIYFGEMTFTNGSGLDAIIPEKYDKMLGDLWILPQ